MRRLKFLTLAYSPFYADFLHIVVGFATLQLGNETVREVNMERAWEHGHVVQRAYRF